MKRTWKLAYPYLFLVPAFTLLAAFTYFPIVRSFSMGFFKWNARFVDPVFAGWRNYQNLFANPVFWKVLGNTAIYALVTIVVTFSVSMIIAVLLNGNIRLTSFYKVGLFYPTMIPMAAGALLWMFMFMPMYGLIDHYLIGLGFPGHNWLNESRTALGCIIVVGIWKRLGYYAILFLAGLQNIPKELYESARIDGAGAVRSFLRITFPMLSSYSFFIVITSIVDALQSVDQVYIMTQGGPSDSTNVIVYHIYEWAFKNWDRGMGSAITNILLLFLLAVTVLLFSTIGKKVYYEV